LLHQFLDGRLLGVFWASLIDIGFTSMIMFLSISLLALTVAPTTEQKRRLTPAVRT